MTPWQILENTELNLYYAFDKLPIDIKQGEQKKDLQEDAYKKFVRASSTVRLLASPDVEAAREKIRDKHNKIQNDIGDLMEAARTGPPEKATALAADLHKDLDIGDSRLVPNFIDAAKSDLKLAGN